MKVIVFDVAAESGGALTILMKYYNEALKKKEHEWHFILSTPELASKNNVTVHRYPWIKKSWFHRLFFDFFLAHKLIKDYNGDVVFSLQNIVIPFVKTRQVLYFHQILPFSEKKFSLIEEPIFWIYQNIIGKFIVYSIKNADKIIVQANWIKNMFIKDYSLKTEKIIVQTPDLNINVQKKFENAEHDGKTIFFYPASAAIYKNHQLIIEASRQLVSKGITDFEVVLTLFGNEDAKIKKIKKTVELYNLPIKFIGQLSLLEVYEMYSKSILLFPSYIETFGLPLIEARMHETPILVSELEYAKEALKDYSEVRYFDPFDSRSLYNLMKQYVN